MSSDATSVGEEHAVTPGYPGLWAARAPDRPAVVMAGTGEVVTFAELDAESNRLAHALRAAGLRRGDHLALFMENDPRFFTVLWAALRSGLYLTTVNSFLTASEAGYVIADCGARALVTTASHGGVAAELGEALAGVDVRLMTDDAIEGFERFEDVLARHAATPIDDESSGSTMLYSSGTSDRPKGVIRPLPDRPAVEPEPRLVPIGQRYGFGEDTRFLQPAPLYHAAPLTYVTAVHHFGGAVVVMERFDAEAALATIEHQRVTHSQWVPTMFSRMLKLPPERRLGRDLSSHRLAIHGAAPCPPEVKRQMIEWWGPILYEFYGGTESNGTTAITSEEWLEHPGSVGRARIGAVHVVDDHGNDLPAGVEGLVCFSGGNTPFEYHNDAAKTADSRLPGGRTTLGDVGYLDDEGYLYLTDRKTFMIISGGVNIAPREIEDVLVLHEAVADVAVIGVPHADLGEEVKAVVQLVDGVEASDALAAELQEFCRARLAPFKVPRSVDFDPALPRLPTGKLYKRQVRARYWPTP